MSDFYNRELTEGEGGSTLTLTVASGRKVMGYQIEMIASNGVGGLLPFRYLTVDGKPRFHYDVTGLVALDRYIESGIRSIRFLAEVLMEISVAAGGLEKYLLEEKCLLLKPCYVFVDPARKGVKLVYLPVEAPDGEQAGFSDFVLDIVKSFRPDDTTSRLFCRRIIEEVKKAGFRYDAFIDFLMDILCFSGAGQNDAPTGYAPAGSISTGVPAVASKQKGGGRLAGMAGMIKRRLHEKNGTGDGFGKTEIIFSAFVSAAIVIVYFVLVSFFPLDMSNGAAIRGAVLLAGVGAELFFLTRFISKPGRKSDSGGKADSRGTIDLESKSDAKAGSGARIGHSGKKNFVDAVHAAANIYDARNAESSAEAGRRPADDLWGNSVAGAGKHEKPRKTGDAAESGESRQEGEPLRYAVGGYRRDPWDMAAVKSGTCESMHYVGGLSEEFADKPSGEFADEPSEESAGDPSEEFVDRLSEEFTDEPSEEFMVGLSEEFTDEPSEEFTGEKPPAGDSGDARGLAPMHSAEKVVPFKPRHGYARESQAAPPRRDFDGIPDDFYYCPSNDVEYEIQYSGHYCDIGYEYEYGHGRDTPHTPQAQPMPYTPYTPRTPHAMQAPGEEAQPADSYPQTVLLPAAKTVDATLLIRDVMRVFGVTLTKNEFTIGRKKEYADLVLDNPAVGKTHAKLCKEGENWYLIDLCSKNGTYLNNIMLENGGKRRLNRSDMITVANVDMIFTPSPDA